MAIIQFISSLVASGKRRKDRDESFRYERFEPVQVRLSIIETSSYFQESMTKEGVMTKPPKAGEPFRLMNFAKDSFIHSTTNVVEVIDKDTFRTQNSKYRLERIA